MVDSEDKTEEELTEEELNSKYGSRTKEYEDKYCYRIPEGRE